MKREHRKLNPSKLYRLPEDLIDGYQLYATKGKECLVGRPLRTGNVSLFWYTFKNGKKKIVRTGRVLYPETSVEVKHINQSTIEEVQANKVKQSNADYILFADFVVEAAKDKSVGARKAAKALKQHMNEFKKDVYLSDIDTDFVLDFVSFLKDDARVLTYKDRENAPHIKPNTQNNMLVQLSVTLNEAVRKGLIDTNPVEKLAAHERPKKELYNRTYLTREEVKELANTPFPVDSKDFGNNVPNAFIFSCFVGLRFSDVSKITGKNVGRDDNGLYIRFKATKTRREQTLYIPKVALEYMPKEIKPTVKLFSLPSNEVCNKEVRKWAKAAGLKEADNVTFHVSRHTAATMYLNAGATLETVAFQLGHKSTRVTQIYAEVMNGTQKAAANKLDKFFE